MSAFGPNRPVYLRTYGKQKRKVEKWFSPDLRKKVFSFSSTSLSDQSIPEVTYSKKRKKKSNASAAARRTHKATTALKELESNEENVFIPDTESRNKVSTRPVRSSVAKKPPGLLSVQASENEQTTRRTMRKRKKKPQVLQSTDDEDDSSVIKNKCSNAYRSSDHKEKRGSTARPLLGRFVTHRRRALPIQAVKQTSKQSFGVPNCTLDSSEDFTRAVPSLPRCVTRRKRAAIPKEFGQENSDPKPSVASLKSSHARSSTVLREVSFNDSVEERISCKRPLLCSTPSLVSRQNLLYLEPSVIEISSFSCDELDKPPIVNSMSNEFIKPQQFTMRQNKKQRSSRIQEIQSAKRVEESVENQQTGERLNIDEGRTDEDERSRGNDQRNEACEEGQTSGSIGFVSAQTHLDSRVEQLKERCCSVSAVVLVEEMDVVDFLSKQSYSRKLEEHETYSPCLETESSTSANSFSSAPPSSLSIPSRSTLPASDSIQTLVDRLKVECLSSCLTVSLQALDPNLLHRFQQVPVESPKAQATSPLSPEVKSDEKRALHSGNTHRLNSQLSPSSGSEGQATGLVRRLSDLFTLPAVSPAPVEAPSKSHVQVVPKEPPGAGTARKACVRGLSVSRWSKRDTGEQRKKQRKKNEIRTRTKPEDCSLNYPLPARRNAHAGESMCGWLPGNSAVGLPVTPLRVEQLNLSSILANFTPDTLTTHSWGRLKAALSVHKKKTAFPTPRQLAQSNLNSPGVMDASMELFGTPLISHTPLSKLASSRVRYSTMTNASTGPDDEDISDAEKVYQECQQDGPLSFDDCIPPEQMKRCTKIGEGTFGEVFSTISSSGQTVALKIIPVEGGQKVNGEAQKTFGEILHEIIISKELSSLDSKNNNKTNGFIGLNNLHCVRGCYPSALLKCWDKFDRAKGSENDRPDFFSDEQFFVILEFEFGGSDLENMKGKLSSMAQAKSILHQVTAALAVAEQALCFEHRDLHWGNILVKTTKEKENSFILNGSVHSVETRGVHVNIIDYSLSRLEIDGLTVSCDIANDEELFMGHGDYQFEIYRLMKKENNNCWGEYNPHSNVLWLHYLVDKLLTMKYKSKAQSSQQKAMKSCLKSFHSEILSYRSATDALLHCSLFQ